MGAEAVDTDAEFHLERQVSHTWWDMYYSLLAEKGEEHSFYKLLSYSRPRQ